MATRKESKSIAENDITAAEEQIQELSKRIEFYLTEYSIELLAKKMKEGEFIVPAYQREYTWEPERKSRFIESLLLGLPIPFLFFWEMPDGKLEIVDGSQRLRTIEEFLYDDLYIGELETLTAISGFQYKDLPESRQRKVKNRSIRGIILNEHADEQARFDLFERINTGSKIANKAEVRRGALSGVFMELIVKVSKLEVFKNIAPMSSKMLKERGREELVTRFFAYSDGLEEYKDRPAEFLFNYVKKMNVNAENDPSLIPQYEKRFTETMEFISKVFPNGFRKTKNGKATPRARFEAISIGTRRALDEREGLKSEIKKVSLWLDSEEFAKVTGADGANATSRLNGRINFVRNHLLG